MAKPNFSYIRKLINNKMFNLPTTNTSASYSACAKESRKLMAAAVKKASKETLARIVLNEVRAEQVLKVPDSYELRDQRLKELYAPYSELLSQLDSLELKAAMGSDPSEELKKIVAAIEKL